MNFKQIHFPFLKICEMNFEMVRETRTMVGDYSKTDFKKEEFNVALN
jgi:hypothetical protein